MKMIKKYLIYIPYAVFSIGLLSTLGSLYFSEIMKLPPCVLCWYQRVAMYPIMIIVAVAIMTKDTKRLPAYVLPFSISGLFIAIYHNLLYYNILPESAAPCINGVSCTTKFFEWFGFITIPFMSMLAFALLTGLMIIYSLSFRAKSRNLSADRQDD
ncbi:MAG: disulfide bond formation protein B [Patescibacteria group bacterium]